MKFLCDSMLNKLGKFLRVLGYDTIIVDNKVKDEEILKRAIEENRYIITRDRDFEKFLRVYNKIIILKSNSLKEQILELKNILKENLNLKPRIERCILCNGKLIVVKDKNKLLGKVPKRVIENYDTFYVCSNCGQIYWEGSKWKRIKEFILSIDKN